MALEPLNGKRQRGESDNAVIACNDYLRMGPGRSLANLLERYQTVTDSPPTTRLPTLKDWSRKFGWVGRASDFDATWELRKTAERNAELNYGLALDYERVRKLKRLADFLERQIFETVEEEVATGGLDYDFETGELISPQTAVVKRYPNVWVRDIKGIGKGDDFEKVTIERFNPSIFSEYRAVLDDLAKEVGGRIRKSEVSTKDWQDRAVEDIKNGVIPPEAFYELVERFDDDLATQLFARAGVPVPVRPAQSGGDGN